MGVFIKFKILETKLDRKTKKCISFLLYYRDFISIETDFENKTIRLYDEKKGIDKFEDVILKTIEVINEKGVNILCKQ